MKYFTIPGRHLRNIEKVKEISPNLTINHHETPRVWQAVEEHYNCRIIQYFPNSMSESGPFFLAEKLTDEKAD